MEPEIVHAVVTAAGEDIPYRRAGFGPPVLLLRSRHDDDTLLSAIASRHRVVEPVCPAFGGLASRLRGLLDGLGVEQVAVVAEDALAIHALAFALTDPLRIERLVLLAPVALDRGVVDAGSVERFERRGRSFLFLHTSDVPREIVADRVLAFLAEEEECPRTAE